MGIIQLTMITLEAIPRCPRYSLFIVPLGYLALGLVLTIFDRNIIFKRTVQTACIVFAFLSVLHWSGSVSSSQLGKAITDFVKGNYMSRYCYSNRKIPYAQAWALLDYLTIDDPRGLRCYVSMSDRNLTSPIYGTRLQNRIWSFQSERSAPPDAFFYYYKMKGGKIVGLRYPNPKITIAEVMITQKYTMVMQGKGVSLFIGKDYLLNPEKQQKLAEYYKKYLLKDSCLLMRNDK